LRNDPNNPTTISNNMVLAVFQDSFGDVWVGTEKGLNKFEPETLTFRRFYADSKNESALPSDMIWCFYEHSDRTLWIGTGGGGLVLWRPEDRTAQTNNFERVSRKISI